MKGAPLHIKDYDYELPEDRIAKYPLKQRDASKLLVYRQGHLSHTLFRHVTTFISADDLVVFNNTKVIQARFLFIKPTGAVIEILCLEPKDPPDYELSFQQKSRVIWYALIGNVKKWKNGPLYKTIVFNSNEIIIKAEKLNKINSFWSVCLSWEPKTCSFREILEMAGSTPLPPYLKRKPVPEDKHTYQTVYSQTEGSIAAPTAGFHFTPGILSEINKKGVDRMELTLHIGAGTFRPVLSAEIAQHTMHEEHIFFKQTDVQRLSASQDNILAIGTTSTRILETIYWLGCKIVQDPNLLPGNLNLRQWEDQALVPVSKTKSMEAIINFFEKHNIKELHTTTRLMIIPGYFYRIVNKMLTNFHQPKSTLLLLISAFIGEDWKNVYSYAMENDFRFLSYGDSSLLIPKQ